MDIEHKEKEKLSVRIMNESQSNNVNNEKTHISDITKHILTCSECKKNTGTWCGSNPPNSFMCCLCQIKLLHS